TNRRPSVVGGPPPRRPSNVAAHALCEDCAVPAVRVLVVATAVALGLGASAAPAAEAPGLEVVAPSQLVLTAAGGESSKVSVWLRNASDGEATPRFTTSLEDADGDAVPSDTLAVVTVDDDGKQIPTPAVGANGVERYRLFFKGGRMGSNLSGQL